MSASLGGGRSSEQILSCSSLSRRREEEEKPGKLRQGRSLEFTFHDSVPGNTQRRQSLIVHRFKSLLDITTGRSDATFHEGFNRHSQYSARHIRTACFNNHSSLEEIYTGFRKFEKHRFLMGAMHWAHILTIWTKFDVIHFGTEKTTLAGDLLLN